MKTLVTGSAGFIGFHLSLALLERGEEVIGVDSMTDYYDPLIKEKRNELLLQNDNYTFCKVSIADYDAFKKVVGAEKPVAIVHLAAQAGVRYSLTNPWAYVESNYLGTLNVFECAKEHNIKRVIYASSSSVYGSNTKLPFSEDDTTDSPVSIYGASKKANEVLAHSYTTLYGIPSVGLRFFTVYGTYGRPDLALFKFTKKILNGEPIEVYNNGDMKRSFTYVDDIVSGICSLLDKNKITGHDIYNLGGAESVPLKTFVSLIEKNLGVKAEIQYLPMQLGDMKETVADTSKAKKHFGFVPRTNIEEGIATFTNWFKQEKDWLLRLKDPR